MSKDHSRPYSWESLMPEGCSALMVGGVTRQGDRKLSCDGTWKEVTPGQTITNDYGPVCRPDPVQFSITVWDLRSDMPIHDMLVNTGKTYRVNNLGELYEAEAAE